MKKIIYLLELIKTNLYLLMKKINFKNKIEYTFITLFKKNCTIKQSNYGTISLGKKITFSNNVELNANGGKIILKGNNYINRNTIVASHNCISIGKNTTIGPNVLIYDHDHDFRNEKAGDFKSKAIHIGENVWIGGGCIILKGVNIGNNSVIAAGSIITKDVEPNCVVYQKKQTTIKNKNGEIDNE